MLHKPMLYVCNFSYRRKKFGYELECEAVAPPPLDFNNFYPVLDKHNRSYECHYVE